MWSSRVGTRYSSALNVSMICVVSVLVFCPCRGHIRMQGW